MRDAIRRTLPRALIALATLAAAPARAADCTPVAVQRSEYEQVKVHLPDSTILELRGADAALALKLINAVPPETSFSADGLLVIETPALGLAFVAFESGENVCGGVKLKMKLWRSILDAAKGTPA